MTRFGGTLAAGILIAVLAGCGGGNSTHFGGVIMSVSNSTLAFNATFGLPFDPGPMMSNVTNTGSGTLTFTAMSDSPWLTVAPTSGTAPQALTIFPVLGTLTSGTYTGHVTVAAAGATGSPAKVTVTFTVAAPAPSNTPFWAQWGANPQHEGMVSQAGQSLAHQLADIVYDPFVSAAQTENGGELLAHYQATIVDGNDVYMMMKTGNYTPCNPAGAWANGAACGPNAWSSMIWNEARFTWENGRLIQVWSFQSDWKPETNGSSVGAWEPVFHAVDANNFIYIPGAGGTIWKVNKTDGSSASLINPFKGAGIDVKNTFVSGPLTADANGNIYYNVIELADQSLGDPWSANDVANAWLVKVTSSDVASTKTYATLVPGTPLGTAATCPGTFSNASPVPALPWPPSTTSVAPMRTCGSQRPGVNIAPAVAPDGTIYTASRAHFDRMQAYLVAVNPDLSPKWAASLQLLLNDGCGTIVPIGPTNTTPNACRVGANSGVDPTTNAKGSGSIYDQGSSSPTVLPDGSVVFGALTNYNDFRGHLFHFDSSGAYLNAHDFGWDTTPGVYIHNGTYSILLKDNHYDGTLYCGGDALCQQLPPGPYYITQLDANFNVEWKFMNTTIDAGHPNGYEWCINMPAVDKDGNVYVNSEDGNIYELTQPITTGPGVVVTTPGGKIFLKQALGAAYTPLSIGPDGRLYTQNDGHMFVVGN